MERPPANWYATPESRKQWLPMVRARIKEVDDRIAEEKRRERLSLVNEGVYKAIEIIEERGRKIRGAIQPDRTIKEIRERLLNDSL